MSEEVKLSVLLTLAIMVITLGVDYLKAGLLLEGALLVLLGLLIIVVYYAVVMPTYMRRRLTP